MDENELESVVEVARGMRDENINISDVIEIIETDPDFRESSMFNGGCEISQVKNNINNNNSAQTTISAMPVQRRPYVRIGEQPASKALRFRYECEGRSAGSIPGASSTPENKTFPSIQIVGYQGRAVVVVSCVTKDDPYRPHPHNLVGREGCKKGVCTLEISPETMSVTFSNLGIQCVKKKDIENALRVRQEIRVDPYRTGFAHSNQPTSIDLNAVRLCFQVFLEGDKRGKFTVPLAPVVSDAIFDKKAMSDLIIVKLSDCVSYVDGGRKDIILLCEKVAKEDIQVRFYEEKEGIVVWEAFGDFQPSQVHKQTAIWFRAPRYRTLEVTEPVKIFIQLRRPSDGACSESLPFELLPLDSEPGILKRKRQKFDENTHMLGKYLGSSNPMINIPMKNTIKSEPKDGMTPPYGYEGHSPLYATQEPSPQYRLPMASPNDQFVLNNAIVHQNPIDRTMLPPINNISPHHTWNITYTPSNPINIAGPSTVNQDSSSFLDLDNQQAELVQINLYSGELAATNMPYDPNNLSETFSNNLSLSDVGIGVQDQNMTDSLTRLANSTIEGLYQTNDFKR